MRPALINSLGLGGVFVAVWAETCLGLIRLRPMLLISSAIVTTSSDRSLMDLNHLIECKVVKSANYTVNREGPS